MASSNFRDSRSKWEGYSDDVKLSGNRYSWRWVLDLSVRRKQNVVEKSRILLVAEETFVTSQIFEIERREGKEQRGGDLFCETDVPFHGGGPSRAIENIAGEITLQLDGKPEAAMGETMS